jgi:uncharacterized protein YhbP (UPF0306 family)
MKPYKEIDKPGADADPDENDLAPRAEALINGATTMTIATAFSGSAWAAPVYYAYHRRRFYFFSSPSSRHITDALAGGGLAACSIHAQASSWREIKGLQMEGEISQVSSLLEGAEAVAVYLRKFPFTTDFFKGGALPDMKAFSERFGVRLYAFRPRISLYCDNSIRFGFRKEVILR